MEIFSQSTVYEQQLIGVIRKLPVDRILQVIDFAKSLEFQIGNVHDNPIHRIESEEEIAEENARWDTLFAGDDAQNLLEKMADEALAEINAGHSIPMSFTEDGQIRHG